MVRNFSRSTVERTSDWVQTNGNNVRNASKPPANDTHDLEPGGEKRLLTRRISADVLKKIPFSSYNTISLNRSTRDI